MMARIDFRVRYATLQYWIQIKSILSEIATFAEIINQGSFSKDFFDAKQFLFGVKSNLYYPELKLPEENLKLFSAATKAFVFGGMGSWGDVPPGVACEMGLITEYEILTDRLYKCLISTILYSVNEW